MNLSLIAKSGHPDLYELGPTEIRISSKRNSRFEIRSPYSSLSATYSIRGPKRLKKGDFAGKIIAFSILPILFIYYSFEVGWILAVFAIPLATPLFFVVRGAMRKPISILTFIERSDGDFAFHIPYYAEEEVAVMEFTKAIQARIQNENGA